MAVLRRAARPFPRNFDHRIWREGLLELDPGHPLAQALVGFWPLAGDALDYSGNGNNGTLVGSPTAVIGPNGPALSFNGSSQDISTSKAFAYNYPAVTYVLRIMSAATQAAIFLDDSSYDAGVGQTGGLGIGIGGVDGGHTGNQLLVPLWGVSWQSQLATLSANVWYDVAVVLQGSKTNVYVNGVLVLTGSATISAPVNSPLFMARDTQASNPRYFQGSLGRAAVYASALTPSSVAWLYAEPLAMFRPKVWRQYYAASNANLIALVAAARSGGTGAGVLTGSAPLASRGTGAGASHAGLTGATGLAARSAASAQLRAAMASLAALRGKAQGAAPGHGALAGSTSLAASARAGGTARNILSVVTSLVGLAGRSAGGGRGAAALTGTTSLSGRAASAGTARGVVSVITSLVGLAGHGTSGGSAKGALTGATGLMGRAGGRGIGQAIAGVRAAIAGRGGAGGHAMARQSATAALQSRSASTSAGTARPSGALTLTARSSSAATGRGLLSGVASLTALFGRAAGALAGRGLLMMQQPTPPRPYTLPIAAQRSAGAAPVGRASTASPTSRASTASPTTRSSTTSAP